MLNISTDLGNKICQHYETEKAVCPPYLRGGLFTTAAVDNIEHNPSSTTTDDSFHGTDISLFQHPNSDTTGVKWAMQHCDDTQTASKKTLAQLPESYTSVPSAPVPRKGKFIVMFGELHMEMAALKTLVDLLDNSGWTSVLVEAGVATSGTADSFLKTSHVTRTRRVHQVTACALYLLLQNAYDQDGQSLQEGESVLPREDWCSKQAEVSPQFQFWLIILKLGARANDLELMQCWSSS